jgi:hypothetical protein
LAIVLAAISGNLASWAIASIERQSNTVQTNSTLLGFNITNLLSIN